MHVHLYGSCYYQEPPHTKHLQCTKHWVAFDTHALSHLNFTPCNVGTVIATVLMRKQRSREVQVTTECGPWEKFWPWFSCHHPCPVQFSWTAWETEVTCSCQDGLPWPCPHTAGVSNRQWLASPDPLPLAPLPSPRRSCMGVSYEGWKFMFSSFLKTSIFSQ